MAATGHLSYLLTHQLANDDALASNPLIVETALSLLEGERLVAEAEREARETSTPTSSTAAERAASTLHRWQLRLSSLVSLNSKVSSSSSSSTSAVQAAGFLLVLRSCQQSDPFFFAHSKQWYTSAITLLSRKAPPTGQLAAAAIDFLIFCFRRALISQEYAREVANPAGVRKLGEGLLALAANDGNDAQTRLHALNSLSDLIRISASPLRPLAQQLQIVSVTLLCQWSSGAAFGAGQDAAARLLGSVYITAGKAQAGQGWRRTVESLVGSSHQLITTLASTLVEEYGAPGNLAPLDMPPLPQANNRNAMDQIDALYPALDRLEAVTGVLASMLASATERTVPVPLTALVRLCQRLFSLTIYSPQRDRTDANLYQVQATLLPKLHVLGCKLFSQLAISLGDCLTPFSSQVLAQIAFVQGTYASGSPIRCSFYAVSSVLVSSCPVHPDDGSKSLAKIVRSILEDAAFLVDPDEGRSLPRKEAPTNPKNGQDERKAKRQKMYDTEQGHLNVRRRTDELEVEVVRHGLSSLNRILQSSAWLLPPSQMNVVLRVLLAFSLSPHFFLTVSMAVAPSLLSEAISLCPALRSTILSCLVASLHTVARESSGMLDHAMSVFRRGLASSVGAGERSLCEEGLRVIQASSRPVVPPMLRTKAMTLVMRQMAGGDVDRRAKEQRSEDTAEVSAYQPATVSSGYTFQQPAATKAQQHYPSLANHVIQPDISQPAAPVEETPRPSIAVAEAATLSTGDALPFVEPVRPPAHAESTQAVPMVSEAAIEVAVSAGDGSTEQEEEEDTAMLELPGAAPPVPVKKLDDGSSDDSDDDDAPLPIIVMSDDE